MKYLLITFTLLSSLEAFSQQDDWKLRSISLGIYYSYVDYAKLNNIVTNLGFPEFNSSPFGISYFGVSNKNKIELLFSSGLNGGTKQKDSAKSYMFEYFVDCSIGYRIVDKDKIGITPFIGVRGLLNGYWLSNNFANTSLSGVLVTQSDAYNFFSMRTSIITGAQIGLFKNKEGYDLVNIRFDITLWSPYTDFFRPGLTYDETLLMKQGIYVYLGIYPGF